MFNGYSLNVWYSLIDLFILNCSLHSVFSWQDFESRPCTLLGVGIVNWGVSGVDHGHHELFLS